MIRSLPRLLLLLLPLLAATGGTPITGGLLSTGGTPVTSGLHHRGGGTPIQPEPGGPGVSHPGPDTSSEPTMSGPASAPSTVPDRSEPDTGTRPEPHRTGTHPPTEPPRTGTQPGPDTGTEPQPDRTEPNTETRAEPYRTETPGAHPPSEPHGTHLYPHSEPQRTEAASSLITEEARTAAEPGPMGRQKSFMWNDIGRTEPDQTRPAAQTHSASVITPKAVTRRHISKRTPHMDTTYISTPFTQGGDGTLSSVTNGTDVSNITENPTNHTAPSHVGSTNTGPEKSGFATKGSGNTTQSSEGPAGVAVVGGTDSRNTTQDSVTISQGSGNVTEALGIGKTSSDSEPSTPITHPLQTPSYPTTTDPTPTSHHVSESSGSFTGVPVTAPNTTSNFTGTDLPTGEATTLTSFSNFSSPGVDHLPPTLSSTPPSSEVPSSSSRDPTTVSNQSSSDVSSSSPIPSTLVFSPFSTTSISPTPEVTSTKSPVPPTTLPTTSALPPSSPSTLPPSSHTSSSSTSYRTPEPPQTRTDGPTIAGNSSITGFRESHSPGTEPAGRSSNITAATSRASTTLKSILDTQTPIPSVADRGGQSTTVVTQLEETTAEPTNPSTTSIHLLMPSPRYTTPEAHQETLETTLSGGPALTTGDPDTQVTTLRTTTMDYKTVMPKLDTTVSTKGKMVPPHVTTSSPAVPTVKHSTPSTTMATHPPTPAVPTSSSPPASANLCSPNPCRNGGTCAQLGQHTGYRCDCPAGWQGEHCDSDVDECRSGPCPPQTTCVNSRGSFSCRCPLGYILEKSAGCVQVRTFLGHIEIPRSFLNGSSEKHIKLQQIEEEIVHFLNSSFSVIGGYYQSSVMNSSLSSRIVLSVQSLFSLSSNVSVYELRRGIQRNIKVCESALERSLACQLFLNSQLHYIVVSLCSLKNPGCDNETAECADPGGIAFCQCKPGYFQYSKTDRSCRACDDGYRLQEGACVRCPFGLGGFNCSNPYQLITVIIAAAGGGLLLVLGIALAVTCCRKSKHDISKLIFKSGDFQMSPYAEYPKAPRSSDWGRETIEMQENGSTKNLLQMTDVYYSPGLRNSEMERNGLYPYAGLPGSRHSCIYPGQYNPTFINEENRRRDYF